MSSKYVSKLGEHQLILIGVRLFILAPIILSSSFLISNLQVTAVAIVISIATGFSATGFIIPNAYSLGVKSFNTIAGMAGAFFGFAQMFGGCLYGYFISTTSSYSIIPLFVAMIVTFIVANFSVRDFKKRAVLQEGVLDREMFNKI